MAFPTDSKLLNRSRVRLVKLCHKHGVVLRQSYARKGPEALLRANRYGHARQMKRMGGQVKKLKTYLGRVVRDTERKIVGHKGLTDRGTEYCGRADKHDYQLFLAINDIDHTKTKVKSPQTNGIRERFHKTVLQEFYQVAFRKRLYDSVDALQDDLDQWLHHYNTERTHQGKMCCGRTPFQTMIEGKEIWKEKFVN